MSSFSLLRSFSSEASQSTPPKRRINKRFSFYQKHHPSVKDPIGTGSMDREKKMKGNLNRRWSSLKQYREYSITKAQQTSPMLKGNINTKSFTFTETTALSQQSLATGKSSTTSPCIEDQALQKGLSCGTSDVKKKWEVIEHYKESMGGRETISSSLLAVSFKESSQNSFK